VYYASLEEEKRQTSLRVVCHQEHAKDQAQPLPSNALGVAAFNDHACARRGRGFAVGHIGSEFVHVLEGAPAEVDGFDVLQLAQFAGNLDGSEWVE